MKIDLLGFLVVFAIVLVSTVLHELMHGVVAYLLGDTTAKDSGRLSLNPFKHIDPYLSIAMPLALYLLGGPIFGGAKPVPVDTRKLKGGAWGMALVAIAGPLMNFLIALVTFLIGYATGVITGVGGSLYMTGTVGYIVTEIVVINLGFCIFNLIPIPPLDGSRVLYALAPDGAREVMEKIETRYGIIIVLILVIILGSALSRLMTSGISAVLDFFSWMVGA